MKRRIWGLWCCIDFHVSGLSRLWEFKIGPYPSLAILPLEKLLNVALMPRGLPMRKKSRKDLIETHGITLLQPTHVSVMCFASHHPIGNVSQIAFSFSFLASSFLCGECFTAPEPLPLFSTSRKLEGGSPPRDGKIKICSTWGSRDGTVVRTLASHQYVPVFPDPSS